MVSRKSRSGPLDGIFETVALFPWWVGVVLSLVIYAGLHAVANGKNVTVTSDPQAVADAAMGSAFRAAVGVLQYLLPLLCLGGSAASALTRSHRMPLVHGGAHRQSAAALNDMPWLEFELLVGEAFRQRGYKVLELGDDRPDGGVDLMLGKDQETFLVQCKQWKANKVGVRVIRELVGLMAIQGAKGGFVVTSGSFTSEAEWFARDCNVQLIDGESLFGMLKEAQARINDGALPISRRRADREAPNCPVCGAEMRKREARRGHQAGNLFWGCSAYPQCRGTRGDSQRGTLI